MKLIDKKYGIYLLDEENFDFPNLEKMKELGYYYKSIGRETVESTEKISQVK